MSTFWDAEGELDDQQKGAVEDIPLQNSFLLTGPAGSGKTNVLLLRAKWLKLSNHPDFKIVVFTSRLRDFIASGCHKYSLDPNCVVTQMTFMRELLSEFSVPVELSGDFETDRTMLAGGVMALIDSGKVSNTYCDTILLDEAQDYTDTELLAFRGLTKRLIVASDDRQSIYKTRHAPGLIGGLVDQTVELQYHYRSGLSLCKVADAILVGSPDLVRIQETSKYPESTIPSSVDVIEVGSFEEQVTAVEEAISGQLDLYPGELVGVLFPKREQVDRFKQLVAASSVLLSERVWVGTMHSAKGAEFRAVHLVGCESLYRMGPVQKRLIYTALLRGRTNAKFYYTGNIPGYLASALATLQPPAPPPSFKSLF